MVSEREYPCVCPHPMTIYMNIHTDIRADVRVELSVLRIVRPGMVYGFIFYHYFFMVNYLKRVLPNCSNVIRGF